MGAFRWLGERVGAETPFALELVEGAAVLRLEPSVDTVTEGIGDKPGVAVRESFEGLLRQIELPTLALADPEISKTVQRTVQARLERSHLGRTHHERSP